MEGLCPRQQAADDDANSNRVPPPLLPPYPAQRLRPNSLLRISVQSTSGVPTASLPTVAGHAHAATGSILERWQQFMHLALPSLRCGYGCASKTHCRGSLAVLLLRFVLTHQRIVARRRAASAPSQSCVQSASNPPLIGSTGRLPWREPTVLFQLEGHTRPAPDGRQNHYRDCRYQRRLKSP